MGLFGSRQTLKYDFTRGRDDVRARTRAEFLAAAGVGFQLIRNEGMELSDDELEMLAAAGTPHEDMSELDD